MTACLLFACTWLWIGVGYPMVLLVASNRAGGGGGAPVVEGCMASNCAEGGGLRDSSKLWFGVGYPDSTDVGGIFVMKKSLMEWHFLAIVANSDFLLLPILHNVVGWWDMATDVRTYRDAENAQVDDGVTQIWNRY
jgi:hypothetical protein